MSLQSINIGQAANDGTGDVPRSAFQKVNANFAAIAAVAGVFYADGSGNFSAATANQIAGALTGTTATLNLSGATVTLPNTFPTLAGTQTFTGANTFGSAITAPGVTSTGTLTLTGTSVALPANTSLNLGINTKLNMYASIEFANFSGLQWSSNTSPGGNQATGITSMTAGVLSVDTTTAGNGLGSLKLANLNASGNVSMLNLGVSGQSNFYNDLFLNNYNIRNAGFINASAPGLPVGEYTVSGLPAASAWSGKYAKVSNPVSGKTYGVRSNGTNWLYEGDQSIAA